MAIIKQFLIFVFLIFALSSCVTTKKVRYLQNPGCTIPEYTENYFGEDYHVQILDELSIVVVTLDPEMNELFNMRSSSITDGSYSSNNNRSVVLTSSSPGYNSYTIKEDGCIAFPYVGDIPVLGLTTREIKKIVVDTLSTMIKDLSVDVALVNSYFSILGDAKNGRYPITKERLNVFQALALCGDLQEFADRAHIKIVRQVGDTTVVRTFDVRSKDIINSEFYYVQPNDVIYVQSFSGQYFGIASFVNLFSVITSVVSLALIIVKFNDIF